MTDVELRKAVKAECGKIQSDTELASDDIDREGGYILQRIDERITDRKLRSFVGTIAIREYSPHADTVRVIKVYPSDTQLDDRMVLGSASASAQSGGGDLDDTILDPYLWPSLNSIDRMRRVRGLKDLAWGWNHVRRKITIDPAPYQSGDNYWYMSIERANWTLANLPIDLTELIVTGTTWKCLEIVLLQRSQLGGIHREGGFANYPAATLGDWVERKRTDFFDTLTLKAAIYGSK